MKKFLLILVIGLIALFGVVAVLQGPAREFTESLLSDTTNDAPPIPSFTDDSDRDGLSDAKENIYGTKTNQFDTDGDGFSDGEEVKNGFDPTLPGESRIIENEALMANLTVRYFEWAKTVTDVEDPQLNDDAVQRFLEAEGLLEAPLPTISDDEMLFTDNTGPDALRTYFDALAEVTLPEATASYIDLADEVVRDTESGFLDDVILGIDITIRDFSAIPAPPEAVVVHRGQLSTMKALRNLFVDLYSIQSDPVLLVRDIAWGNSIFLQSIEFEKQRQELALLAAPPANTSDGSSSDNALPPTE